MRTCPDCGRELAPGEDRCPLCGAEAAEPAPPALGDTLDELADRAASSPEGPLPEGGDTSPAALAFAEGVVSGFDAPLAAEVKPKRKAAVFVPIAVACAVVLGLAVWLASGLLKSPDKGFLAAHRDLLQSIAQNELAFLAPSGQEAETANVDMTLTAQVDDSLGEAAAILNDAALRMQLEGGKDGAILDAALDLEGDTVLEATVTGNKDGVVGFYIPQFSETYYIMDYFQFVENNSGGEFSADDIPDDAAAWERTLKTYGDILAGVVNKNNVKKVSGTFSSFYMPTVQYSGTAYMFTPTAEDLETMFAQLADALEKDQTLVTLVDGLTDDMLAEAVDEIRTNGPEAARAVADSGFTWTIRVGKGDHGRNSQIEVSWDDGQNSVCLERRTEGGYDDGVYFSVSVDGEEAVKLSTAHTGVDGTWFGFARAGDVFADFQQIDLGKRSTLGLCYGSYNVNVGEDKTLLFSMGVAAGEDGGTDHEVRVYTDTEGNCITLNLHTTDQPVSLTFPDAPKEDITGYTTEDFEALGESWSEGVSALATQFVLYAYQHQ